MSTRPRKAARLTVSLDASDYKALNLIADARDVSLSRVIRQAIKQFIKKSATQDLETGGTKNGRPSN